MRNALVRWSARQTLSSRVFSGEARASAAAAAAGVLGAASAQAAAAQRAASPLQLARALAAKEGCEECAASAAAHEAAHEAAEHAASGVGGAELPGFKSAEILGIRQKAEGYPSEQTSILTGMTTFPISHGKRAVCATNLSFGA